MTSVVGADPGQQPASLPTDREAVPIQRVGSLVIERSGVVDLGGRRCEALGKQAEDAHLGERPR